MCAAFVASRLKRVDSHSKRQVLKGSDRVGRSVHSSYDGLQAKYAARRFDTARSAVILARSNGGAHQPFGQIIKRQLFYLIYETTIPALKEAAEAAAWISQPQFQQKRPRHPEKSPPGWAQAPHARLIVPAWGQTRQPGCVSVEPRALRKGGISAVSGRKGSEW